VVDAGGLLLADAGEWPFPSTTRIDDEGGAKELRLAFGDARLSVADPAFSAALAAAAPHLAPPRFGRRLRRVIILAGAGAAILAALWWGLPRATPVIAALLPASFEEALGNRTVAEIPGRRCTASDGQAALDALVTRLVAGTAIPYTIEARVLDRPEINAVAAPGGHIVILRGLLDQAASADEVAGVLAHEIGHTLKRHDTQRLIRMFGLSVLGRLLAGSGSAASVGQTFLLLSYTRKNEAEADVVALELLRRAQIGSGGLASFFERMAAKERSGFALPRYLSTHPSSRERLEAVRAHGVAEGKPALSPAQWRALKEICRG
jgi:predicted Zn-dependent protease